jgi:hypothetical protein
MLFTERPNGVKGPALFRSRLWAEATIMNSRSPVWIALLLMVLAIVAGVAATTVLASS